MVEQSFPIGLAVLIQYRSVTDTQPATQPRCHSYYAQRSGVEPKNEKAVDYIFITRPWDLHGWLMAYYGLMSSVPRSVHLSICLSVPFGPESRERKVIQISNLMDIPFSDKKVTWVV